MREQLNSKMMRVPISYADEMTSGDLSTRFTSSIPAVSKLISTDYTGFIIHMTMIVSILAMMLVTSPVLGLLYMALIPIILVIGREITKRSEKDFVIQSMEVAELNSQMSNMLSTHKTIKTEVLEANLLSRFGIYNREYTAAYVGAHTRSGMIKTIAGIMVNVGYLLSVIAGSLALFFWGMDVGMFLTFMIYVRVLNTPLLMTVTVFDSIREETISLMRVLNVLNAPEDDMDVPDDGFRIEEGVIKVEDVTFSYGSGKRIFTNASVEIRPGEFTVVTGSTGSGKTTLANLIMGFYYPQSGFITVDGREVSTIPREEIGRNMNSVLQSPWMFNGTIRENIIYNRTDISDDEMIRTAKMTGLHNYVSSLPQGYDTYVSEEIAHFPLAQRRMLALSRALVGDPKILILDEAVAGLDPLTGQGIIDTLMSMKEGRTIIIITHNEALIEQADAVISIEDETIKRS